MDEGSSASSSDDELALTARRMRPEVPGKATAGASAGGAAAARGPYSAHLQSWVTKQNADVDMTLGEDGRENEEAAARKRRAERAERRRERAVRRKAADRPAARSGAPGGAVGAPGSGRASGARRGRRHRAMPEARYLREGGPRAATVRPAAVAASVLARLERTAAAGAWRLALEKSVALVEMDRYVAGTPLTTTTTLQSMVDNEHYLPTPFQARVLLGEYLRRLRDELRAVADAGGVHTVHDEELMQTVQRFVKRKVARGVAATSVVWRASQHSTPTADAAAAAAIASHARAGGDANSSKPAARTVMGSDSMERTRARPGLDRVVDLVNEFAALVAAYNRDRVDGLSVVLGEREIAAHRSVTIGVFDSSSLPVQLFREFLADATTEDLDMLLARFMDKVQNPEVTLGLREPETRPREQANVRASSTDGMRNYRSPYFNSVVERLHADAREHSGSVMYQRDRRQETPLGQPILSSASVTLAAPSERFARTGASGASTARSRRPSQENSLQHNLSVLSFDGGGRPFGNGRVRTGRPSSRGHGTASPSPAPSMSGMDEVDRVLATSGGRAGTTVNVNGRAWSYSRLLSRRFSNERPSVPPSFEPEDTATWSNYPTAPLDVVRARRVGPAAAPVRGSPRVAMVERVRRRQAEKERVEAETRRAEAQRQYDEGQHTVMHVHLPRAHAEDGMRPSAAPTKSERFEAEARMLEWAQAVELQFASQQA